MHAVREIRRHEARPAIYHSDRADTRALRRRPHGNRIAESFRLTGPVARIAASWVHGWDFGDEDAHGWFAGAHLVHERGERGDDRGGGETVPDVVRAEHHHYDVWLGVCEPAGELVVCYYAGGFETAVAFVLAVEGYSAASCRSVREWGVSSCLVAQVSRDCVSEMLLVKRSMSRLERPVTYPVPTKSVLVTPAACNCCQRSARQQP